ncbi:tRNA lysidine(34) synthetase TilS [Ruficoccus amylovorans]|uniref:tRNA(Ile)-lysidine synthase n=1 Tax=Ruficoccus amylovorans TaxID=1804625 RepID=A0A842HD78_9BACT|nr:tRNA lysidine(34) synthetase TilS [Ruficoccus amylovorans]MBC2594453.1 tRNA lysidine(34) synthetase TilS [Ruficoccus amylovorans]
MSSWREKAEAVATSLKGERVYWSDLVEEPIGVGCSGGADSVCLLLLAWLRFGDGLRVLHLNHGLRGADADADSAFVEALAGELGLPFFGKKLDGAPAEASEAWLRGRRMAFYRHSGCATVLLGHHADDVAETMLMRLTRGSGTEGVASPLAVQRFYEEPMLMRPLLGIPKSLILAALQAAAVPWREDASNATPDYFRNRVRADVLPALLEAAPGNARAGLSRSHRLLAEDAEALNAWLDSLGLVIAAGAPLELSPLKNKPAALWRRALQRWIGVNGLRDTLSAAAVDGLLDGLLAGEGGQLSAGADERIIFNRERVYREKLSPVGPGTSWPEFRLRPGLTLWLPGGLALRVERVKVDAATRTDIFAGNIDNRSCVYLDENMGKRASAPLLCCIRQWRAGDRYHPLGAPGSRKLQDCFTDAKILVLERKQLPVVCSPTGNILWVPGLPPAESAKIGPHTQWALRLTYGAH